jgi:2'-5' RNA ligase
MRLFAAVLPPPAAVAELREAVAAVRRQELPGQDRLRWTAEEGWHFTLAFMGEVDPARLDELHTRLARGAHRTDPFTLRVHGSGHFGSRALWAGAAGGLDALRLLADRADAAARRSGIPMEQHRRYVPHLTLARSRGGADADLGPYVAALAGFEGASWQVSVVSLVRSRLPVDGVAGEGPRYEVVREWGLHGVGQE